MGVTFPQDLLEKIRSYIRGLKPRHTEKYAVLWQSMVCSWQFHELQRSIAYYVRFKDKAYLAEAKTHLADLLMQVVAMCLVLDIDPNEIWKMGFNRLEEHANLEIYPRLWGKE